MVATMSAQTSPSDPHASTSSPQLQAIVARMEQAATANREAYRPYIVTREYRTYGSNPEKPSSEVTAEVNFVPPTTKEFRITQSRGSSRGEGVVRHLLEDESKAAASGRAPGAVTRENYEFDYAGEQMLDGHACHVLRLHPKRHEQNLIDGRAWIDKDTYLVRRIQGQMAKMPSWWLRSVEVTLTFGDASGMWLQTGTKAVADVRVFGQHVLTGRAVSVKTGEAVLAKNTGRRPAMKGETARPFRRPPVVGTSVLPER